MRAAQPTISNAIARLWLPKISLAGCVRGAMVRDTTQVSLPPAQRFSHYPATPMCTISWLFCGEAEMLAPGASESTNSERTPYPSSVMFGGPFTRPSTTWSPGPVHGMMLLLLPDAVHHMTGIEPGQWKNKMVSAVDVLPDAWLDMCASVMTAKDDEQRVHLIEHFLDPRWQELRPKQTLGLHRYADWADGLALRAATSKTGRSLRQVERRVRRWAGQPMRELKGFSRAEHAFFDAMEAADDGDPKWPELAADAGYSDQSHLCRESRRITGCSPAELWDRIANDEGFWPYRIWQ